MDETKLDTISYIEDEILTSPEVDCRTVSIAARLAEEDNYLYNIMVDWMKETDKKSKAEMLTELLDYTHEVMRRAGL